MTEDLLEMNDLIDALERRFEIEHLVDAATRAALLADVQTLAHQCHAAGRSVPGRLGVMEHVLLDDVIDDGFDNMPV